jgi:hypothetical protein
VNFLAPIWLLALIPWAGLLIWVLTGRRQRERVPFLRLWNAPEEVQRPKKKAIEPPPLGVALLLLAALAGVLSAAGPVVGRGREPPVLEVIVDRGASMSALGAGGKTRFAIAGDALAEALLARSQRVLVGYNVLPAGEFATREPRRFAEHMGYQTRTAVADSRDDIASLARHILGTRQTVVVISDKELGLEDDRIIQIRPEGTPDNAGIAVMSARSGQVMVRCRSTSRQTRTVRVTSGSRNGERKVDLAANVDTDVFIDFADPSGVIESRLLESDAFDGDDCAWIVRPNTWPAVTAWAPVGEEIRRVLAVYAKHRPAGAGARRVVIVRAGDDLKSEESAVLLAADAGTTPASGNAATTEHPIVSGVDFSPLRAGTAIAAKPPGEGWTIVARLADKPIVAVREAEGVRRAWVGFQSREFARTPAFVLFWSKMLDWVGVGGDEYISRPVGAFSERNATRTAPDPMPADADPWLWPGLFRTSEGVIAMNAGAVEFPPVRGGGDWRERIARLPLAGAAGIALRPWLALAGLALAVLAAAVWPRSRRRHTPSPPAAEALNRAIA